MTNLFTASLSKLHAVSEIGICTTLSIMMIVARFTTGELVTERTQPAFRGHESRFKMYLIQATDLDGLTFEGW